MALSGPRPFEPLPTGSGSWSGSAQTQPAMADGKDLVNSAADTDVAMRPRAAEGKVAPPLGSAWTRFGKLYVSCVIFVKNSTLLFFAKLNWRTRAWWTGGHHEHQQRDSLLCLSFSCKVYNYELRCDVESPGRRFFYPACGWFGIG